MKNKLKQELYYLLHETEIKENLKGFCLKMCHYFDIETEVGYTVTDLLGYPKLGLHTIQNNAKTTMCLEA